MNRKEHIEISTVGGAIVGGLLNVAKQCQDQTDNTNFEFDSKSFLKSILIGALGGRITARMPDIIEPAHNPNHRDFFHSWTFAALLALANKKVSDSNLSDNVKESVQALSVGYGLHLAADSTTKKSLPLL